MRFSSPSCQNTSNLPVVGRAGISADLVKKKSARIGQFDAQRDRERTGEATWV